MESPQITVRAALIVRGVALNISEQWPNPATANERARQIRAALNGLKLGDVSGSVWVLTS